MATMETNQGGGWKVRRHFQITSALAPVSRALYRTGLWLVYGGATAEIIFRAAKNYSWDTGCATGSAGATARS